MEILSSEDSRRGPVEVLKSYKRKLPFNLDEETFFCFKDPENFVVVHPKNGVFVYIDEKKKAEYMIKGNQRLAI